MTISDLVFLSSYDSLDLDKAGGTDAVVRRLCDELINNGIRAIVIRYGSCHASIKILKKNLILYNFTDIKYALQFIGNQRFANVICNYIDPISRLKIILFRIINNDTKFHVFFTNYLDSAFKRYLTLFLYPLIFNGYILCFSRRILNSGKLLGFNSKRFKFLPPSVPDDFFLAAPNFDSNEDKRIAYLGRLDYYKGADIAIGFFESDIFKSQFKCIPTILGYSWKNDDFSVDLEEYLSRHMSISYHRADLFAGIDLLNAEVVRAIDSADIFLLPYRSLSSTVDTPMVVLEAIARCKYVITSSIAKSVLPDSPFLFYFDMQSMSLYEDIACIIKEISKTQYSNQPLDSAFDISSYRTTIVASNLLRLIEKRRL